MNNSVVIPVQQALVPFRGSEILAALLPDGRIAASLASFCEMLKLAKHGQMERIRRNADLAEHLLIILVKTPDGPQHTEALVGEAIHSWVMGIQTSRVSPEKRPLIQALKEEVYQTLVRALINPTDAQAAQPTSGPQAKGDFPEQSAHSRSRAMPVSSWDQLVEGLDEVQEGLDGIREALHDIGQEEQAKARKIAVHEEWLQSLDKRLVTSGQDSAAALGWTPLLSAAHLADAQALLRSLERVTGRTQSQLEQEMLETFKVTAINAIPDEQWQDILEWCMWRAQQPQ